MFRSCTVPLRFMRYNTKKFACLNYRIVMNREPPTFVGMSSDSQVPTERISDAVKRDHRELEEYYDRIKKATDADEQTRYQNLFTWELARHSVAEEIVVYPEVEKVVPNGAAITKKDREEHQKVPQASLLFIFDSAL